MSTVTLRLHRIWHTLLWDPLDWTEIVSGLMLVSLRGAVLKWGPVVSMPYDVASLLRQVGVTEQRWGLYLLACGLVQIWVAGRTRSNLRLGVTIAILTGFVVMAAAFLVIDATVSPSLICMSGFYTLLLGRVFRDRDSATAGAGVEDE